MKENAVAFLNWVVFEKEFAANRSHLWFDSSASRDTVRFYRTDELYDVFISNGEKSIADLQAEKENQFAELLNGLKTK